MKLRIDELIIDRENPFLNDKLDREQSAAVLAELFSKIEGPFAVSLNSTWGTGKTTFIKMLRQHLINKGFPSFYYNAWESEYQDNSLITFIGEINSGIDEMKDQGFDIRKARKTFIKIKKTGKGILRETTPVAVKIAAHGALNTEKGMEDAFSDFTSAVIENQMKNYSSTKEHVIKFREQIQELVQDLQKEENSVNSRVKPLVFFIDELDRCRPDYAVQVLEKMNHFFDVKGVIIVLGIDMEQLGNSVKTVFGQNIKERGYLRRFIDLEYSIPADNHVSELYCKYLSSETAVTAILNKNRDHENMITELKYSSMVMASTFSMSLRDLNIMFNTVYMIFLSYEHLTTDVVALTVILIALKMRNPKLFTQVINRERSVFYLINELNKVKKLSSAVKEYDRFFIERRLSGLSLKVISDDEFQQQLLPPSISSSNELNKIYKLIKDKNNSHETEEFTEILFKKIRLIDSFKFAE